MRKARPGGGSGNGPGKSEITKYDTMPADSPQIRPQERPSVIELPVVPQHLQRERYPVWHVQHSLADALVQAAIKSGKLERLKAALQEGRFDG